MGLAGGPRLNRHLGDATDRGHRFAAKPERADPEQVLGVSELAGRVAGEHERQVGGLNAVPVVDDPDQFGPALFEIDVDAGCPGVDRVFE